MMKSDFVEEAIKALYAISSLVRNNLFGEELFYAEAGETMLQVTKIKDYKRIEVLLSC